MEHVAWIEEIRAEAVREIDTASSEAALEEVRVRYLGRSGRVTRAFRDIAGASPEVCARLFAALSA